MNMTSTTSKSLRMRILDGLNELTPNHRRLFKKIHAPHNMDDPIENTVKSISDDKLEWALKQVENTVRKYRIEKYYKNERGKT